MKIRFDLSENNILVIGTLTIILLIAKLLGAFDKWWLVMIPLAVDGAIFLWMFVLAYIGVVLKKIGKLITNIKYKNY